MNESDIKKIWNDRIKHANGGELGSQDALQTSNGKNVYSSRSSCGQFHILEVNLCTRTQIFANLDTFSVPLLTFVLIVTQINGLLITSLDKYVVLWIGFI